MTFSHTSPLFSYSYPQYSHCYCCFFPLLSSGGSRVSTVLAFWEMGFLGSSVLALNHILANRTLLLLISSYSHSSLISFLGEIIFSFPLPLSIERTKCQSLFNHTCLLMFLLPMRHDDDLMKCKNTYHAG